MIKELMHDPIFLAGKIVSGANNQRLKEYIREVYNSNVPVEEDDLSKLLGGPSDLLSYKYTIEFQQTFPMLL